MNDYHFDDSQWEVLLVWLVMRVARESYRELQKQGISKSLTIRRIRKKENIITYHRQVTVGVMTRTVSSLTSVKKRRKRSVEATSKNKEIEKRRKTLVNSHATLTARLTDQWELRKHSCKLSPANSHRLSSSLARWRNGVFTWKVHSISRIVFYTYHFRKLSIKQGSKVHI